MWMDYDPWLINKHATQHRTKIRKSVLDVKWKMGYNGKWWQWLRLLSVFHFFYFSRFQITKSHLIVSSPMLRCEAFSCEYHFVLYSYSNNTIKCRCLWWQLNLEFKAFWKCSTVCGGRVTYDWHDIGLCCRMHTTRMDKISNIDHNNSAQMHIQSLRPAVQLFWVFVWMRTFMGRLHFDWKMQ